MVCHSTKGYAPTVVLLWEANPSPCHDTPSSWYGDMTSTDRRRFLQTGALGFGAGSRRRLGEREVDPGAPPAGGKSVVGVNETWNRLTADDLADRFVSALEL